MACCVSRCGLHIVWFLAPFRERRIREQARAERSRVHDADAICFEVGNRFVSETGVLQRVLVVAQGAIDLYLVADESENLLGITAKADEAHLTLLLNSPER